MGTKTISLSDEAYLRLARLKRNGESFSDAVMRLTGREDLTRFVGSISPAFARELERSSRAFRRRFERDMDARARRR